MLDGDTVCVALPRCYKYMATTGATILSVTVTTHGMWDLPGPARQLRIRRNGCVDTHRFAEFVRPNRAGRDISHDVCSRLDPTVRCAAVELPMFPLPLKPTLSVGKGCKAGTVNTS